jgi:hypothetical protein
MKRESKRGIVEFSENSRLKLHFKIEEPVEI